jgi:hypothetical protein
MSALPPITDIGRRIQVSIWLSVYEYTPSVKDLGQERRLFGKSRQDLAVH